MQRLPRKTSVPGSVAQVLREDLIVFAVLPDVLQAGIKLVHQLLLRGVKDRQAVVRALVLRAGHQLERDVVGYNPP